ncbi:AGAP005300-PA [Anopheles gambiae str. PEST]|uniref:AGAP005300-PA n=2 Tax=Anopheles gambiae TaxID=7165 RepID=A7US12_ANOGA|nr:AGAP005300-PA [Anopheles gambiae str. PEST]
MLSTKKLFTEHLLTLVLTLSLLRIDPENYLDLQWGGRLARVGDAGGWQLELLAAGPDYSNQSYVNRKFLPPIIEDLSRFERPFIEQNHRGLQTYLLNVLDANDDGASAGTLAEERPPSPVPAVASGGGSGVGVGTVLPAAHNATMHALTNLDVDAEDIFLSADLFEETTSVLEQNMADLSEYDTILLEHPTVKFDAGAASLPDLEGTIARARTLMNEASKKFEVKREEEKQEDQATTSSSATGATPTEGSGAVRANKTRAYEDDDDDEDSEDERDSKEAVQRQINTQQKHLVCTDLDTAEVTVKTEPVETNDTTVQESSTAAAAAQDLTQEEMDLIEVLWKQDVDLGFTLANAGLSNAPEGSSSTSADTASATGIKCDTEDDLEKLKVLLEIKNDKNADYEKNPNAADESSLVDPWAGLSYTIDTETGEYVLNSSDIDNSLPPPLADLFLEEGLTLPDLGETVVDTIAEIKPDDSESDLSGPPVQEEQEIAEVKRIEQELQQVSVGEICLGGGSRASGSSSADQNSNCEDTGEILDTETDSAAAANTTSSDAEGLEAEPVTDDLEDLLCDMMIQTSSHFQHTRQNTQGYGHGAMGSFRQTATGGAGYHHHHHHHHHHHQSRVPLSRAVSMEQRWQDLANLLSFPPGMGVGMGVADMPPSHPSHAHYPSHYPSYQPSGGIAGPQHGQYHHPPHAAVLQNASLADISPAQPHYGANLGSAVATSMHLTNSTSETDAGTSGYKMDPEMMYYSNTSSEMNHTDGFLNSILNDEDLQLMDIAHNGTTGSGGNNASGGGGMLGVSASAASNLVNHGGVHPHSHHHHHLSLMSSASGGAGLQNAMNVSALVNGSSSASSASSGASSGGGAGGASSGTPGDRLDASSDSAVSSMGSERVPSLSDGEWGDGGSDSAQEYHNGKYGGPYDYSYNQTNGAGGGGAGGAGGVPSGRMGEHGPRQGPPVAQKKHHMFAKRYFQEQNTSTVPSIHPSPNGGTAGTAGGPPGLDGGAAGGAAGGGAGATAAGVLLPTAIKYEYDYMNVVGPQTAAGPTIGPLEGAAKQEDHLQHHQHESSAAAAAAAAAALTDMKYPYGIDFPRSHHSAAMGGRGPLQPQDMIHHNHTYTLPFATPNGGGGAVGVHQGPKPQTRDKSRSSSLHSRKAEEEHLTRDEKRARALQIPIPVHDIINLPMDEFNERLSKYDLSETQLSLIRDIRRRGKNKVAAQNCRKRKLDQIVTLADEVKDMKMRKERLMRDREMVLSEHKKIRDKFSMLYRHVFQNLRDADGNPYSQEHYSLQQSADGAVVLVPRNSERPNGAGSNHLGGNSSNGTANGVHPSLHHSGAAGTHHAGHHHQHGHGHHQLHPHHHLQHHHGLIGGGSAAMNGSMNGSLAMGGASSNGASVTGSNHSSSSSSTSSSSSGVVGGSGGSVQGSGMNGTASATAAIVHQRTKE